MSETVYDPSGIPAAGLVTLWWVPAIADASLAPTVLEMGAATNITNAVYSFGDGSTQNTVSRRKYGYDSEVTSFGRIVFSPTALEYDVDPQGTDAGTEYDFAADLTPNVDGFIVHRRGLAPDTAVAADQIVDVRRAKLSEPMPIDVGDTEGEMFRDRQTVIYTGPWANGVAVLA